MKMRLFGGTMSPKGEQFKGEPGSPIPGALRLVALMLMTGANFAGSAADDPPSAKIGRGNRTLQKTLCQVPFSGKGLKEGELAEIVDSSNSGITVVKIESFVFKGKKRLVATVLSGDEKCTSLQGKVLRKLDGSGQMKVGSQINSKISDSIVFIAPQFQVAQSSLPGLALNKFLSPGYTQQGIGFRGAGIFPRLPIDAGPLKINFISELAWSSLNSSPALDLVRDGKVEGSQSIATQNLNLRAGTRIHLLNSRLWTGTGIVVLDSFKSNSNLNATGTAGSPDKLFKAVRDLSGQGFGLYGEQGFVINESVVFAINGGIGLATTVKTPVVEDGEATNTEETVKLESVPLFAGARIQVPFLNWIFAEVNLDYKKLNMTLPLINNAVSKAQYDVMSFSAGVGFRY
ncbi:MAG: hypothetical protein ACO3A4_12950 [Silvanigrellaceae bacterium]